MEQMLTRRETPQPEQVKAPPQQIPLRVQMQTIFALDTLAAARQNLVRAEAEYLPTAEAHAAMERRINLHELGIYGSDPHVLVRRTRRALEQI